MPPLEITVWDVGHGSATYIRTPNDRHIVVDLGDSDNFNPIQTLQQRGVRQLDSVIITHPHRDHLDEIFDFARLAPVTLCTPRHLSDSEIRAGNRDIDMEKINEYLAIRQRYATPVEPEDDLRSLANFGGATFQHFTPTNCPKGNLNDHSMVVVTSYAGSKMVISGDNEAPSWRELLGNSSFVAAVKKADIFLASHHGRNAGYCPELFEAMGQPKLIVISDGRFGDTSATSRYSSQATGWTVYDGAGLSETRKCVTTRCDGSVTVKFGWNNEAEGRRFLNVTTSKANMNALAALAFGLPPRR